MQGLGVAIVDGEQTMLVINGIVTMGCGSMSGACNIQENNRFEGLQYSSVGVRDRGVAHAHVQHMISYFTLVVFYNPLSPWQDTQPVVLSVVGLLIASDGPIASDVWCDVPCEAQVLC